MYDLIKSMTQQIKIQKPLILNITNYVSMEFVANGLLSLGCSPIMSHSKKEMVDLVKVADAVVINIGTLNDEFISLCETTCTIANQLNKPLIFDPVGAGASRYRTETCLDLLGRYQFKIVRGNASEIQALCDNHSNTKGVDSTTQTITVLESAKTYSSLHHSVLVISGETDVIIQDKHAELINRGSALMPLVTGSGCLLTSVIAAFQAIDTDTLSSAIAAVTFYNVCGEQAAKKSKGPGSFKMHFLDELALSPARGHFDV